jgi:hypothetical protein
MRRLLGVAVAAACVLATAQAAAAATWTWQPSHAAQAANGSFSLVSCSSTTTCEALGWRYDPAANEVPDAAGTTGSSAWTNQSVPEPSGATSATPITESCFSGGCVAGFNYSSGSFLVKYNGSSWSSMPAPSGFYSLYGAHSLSCTASNACSLLSGSTVYRWNGSTWSYQPLTTSGTAISCVSSSACAVVGSTNRATPASATWNGSSWTSHPMLSPSTVAQRTYPQDISCTASNACTAVGYYQDLRNRQLPFVERWNGTSWSVQTIPNPGGTVLGYYYGKSLDSVSCGASTDCVALGSSGDLVLHWNGTSWSDAGHVAVPTGFDGTFTGVSCKAANSCFFAGYDDQGMQHTVVQKWNGSTFTQQNTSTSDISGATDTALGASSCVGSSFCMGVGSYLVSNDYTWPASDVTSNGGSTWTANTAFGVPAYTQYAVLNGVSCTTSSSCEAVGYYSTGSGQSGPLAYKWNGTSWSAPQTVPTPSGVTMMQLNGVSCTSASACTAVGSAQLGDGTFTPVAERWNGSTWTRQTVSTPSGDSDLTLNGVSCKGTSGSGACIAVGSFTNSSFQQQPLALSWNGTTWGSPMTTPALGSPYGNVFNSVSCTATNACTAVGIQGYGGALGERLTGSTWSVQSVPTPLDAYNGLTGVSCGTASACEAVGGFGAAGGTASGSTWSWTSQTLAPVNTGSGTVFGVSCTGATPCTAVGGWELYGYGYFLKRTAATGRLRLGRPSSDKLSPKALSPVYPSGGTLELPLIERYA